MKTHSPLPREVRDFITHLRIALHQPLPGPTAQMRMAPPQHRSEILPTDTPRESAVLALLHNTIQGLALLFTLRPTYLRHHAGQISFPGGGVEPCDTTLAGTALRETQEELGFPTTDIQILGKLTPLFIAPSQNLVQPYVGWLADIPSLNPDPVEVAEVLDIPLSTLLDAATTLGHHTYQINGKTLTAPCYRVANICIWGATAMILSELLAIIHRLEDVPTPRSTTTQSAQPHSETMRPTRS